MTIRASSELGDEPSSDVRFFPASLLGVAGIVPPGTRVRHRARLDDGAGGRGTHDGRHDEHGRAGDDGEESGEQA